MTNRKSHTRFRLVPTSTTLDDLEGPLRTLFQNTCDVRLSKPMHHENLNEDVSDDDVDSGNIRFMRIFAGVPWKGASYKSGVIENVFYSGFRTLRIFGT